MSLCHIQGWLWLLHRRQPRLFWWKAIARGDGNYSPQPSQRTGITWISSVQNWPFFTKGRVRLPNRMNFRKNSKWPLTPPPSFLEIILQFFYNRYGYIYARGYEGQIVWNVCTWFPEIRTILIFLNTIVEKIYPQPWIIFFVSISWSKGPVWRTQNLQYKFLDWKWPPPLSLFHKFIRFGSCTLP